VAARIRVGGAHVPGVLSAGRVSHGQLVFWDVHDESKAIVTELRDEHYARLVTEVDDAGWLCDSEAATESHNLTVRNRHLAGATRTGPSACTGC